MYVGYTNKVQEQPTSVSSDLSNSALAGEPALDDRPQNDEADGVFEELTRCRPAFSRSRSFQDRTEARRESISKRFPSVRGVERKERSTLVTKRRSTLKSVELRRNRRRASIRCSFIMTAKQKKNMIKIYEDSSVRKHSHPHVVVFQLIGASL